MGCGCANGPYLLRFNTAHTINSFDTRPGEFCWVPSGVMESAEQTDRAPSKSLACERHALRPLLEARFRGLTKPLRRSFNHFSIDGRVSQKVAKVHQGDSTWPGMPSMWILPHKAPNKRAKDVAC
jgi:hypothetical protein